MGVLCRPHIEHFEYCVGYAHMHATAPPGQQFSTTQSEGHLPHRDPLPYHRRFIIHHLLFPAVEMSTTRRSRTIV